MVERCPDKTEVEGSIPSIRTRHNLPLCMENEQKKESWYKSEYLRIFTRISAWIVGPVLVSVIVGKYLDRKWDSSPWALGVALALSFTISMIAIVRIAKKYDKNEVKEKDEHK